MGNPDYTQRVFATIDATKVNTTKEEDKQIVKIIKRYLTKKEFKSFFILQDVSQEEVLASMSCTLDAFDMYITKARKKLRSDACKNEILRLLKIIK